MSETNDQDLNELTSPAGLDIPLPPTDREVHEAAADSGDTNLLDGAIDAEEFMASEMANGDDVAYVEKGNVPDKESNSRDVTENALSEDKWADMSTSSSTTEPDLEKPAPITSEYDDLISSFDIDDTEEELKIPVAPDTLVYSAAEKAEMKRNDPLEQYAAGPQPKDDDTYVAADLVEEPKEELVAPPATEIATKRDIEEAPKSKSNKISKPKTMDELRAQAADADMSVSNYTHSKGYGYSFMKAQRGKGESFALHKLESDKRSEQEPTPALADKSEGNYTPIAMQASNSRDQDDNAQVAEGEEPKPMQWSGEGGNEEYTRAMQHPEARRALDIQTGANPDDPDRLVNGQMIGATSAARERAAADMAAESRRSRPTIDIPKFGASGEIRENTGHVPTHEAAAMSPAAEGKKDTEPYKAADASKTSGSSVSKASDVAGKTSADAEEITIGGNAGGNLAEKTIKLSGTANINFNGIPGGEMNFGNVEGVM